MLDSALMSRFDLNLTVITVKFRSKRDIKAESSILKAFNLLLFVAKQSFNERFLPILYYRGSRDAV